MIDPKKQSLRVRFSIKFHVILTLLIATALLTYRLSYQVGYREGNKALQELYPSMEVFAVDDRLRAIEKIEAKPSDSGTAIKDPIGGLLTFIQTTVVPEDWDALGGPNSVVAFPARRSIGIYAPSLIQAQITKLLEPKTFETTYSQYLEAEIAIANSFGSRTISTSALYFNRLSNFRIESTSVS